MLLSHYSCFRNHSFCYIAATGCVGYDRTVHALGDTWLANGVPHVCHGDGITAITSLSPTDGI